MSRLSLMSGVAAVVCLAAVSSTACAQAPRDFNIPAGPMRNALTAFATQSDQQIFFTSDMVEGLRSPGVTGRMEPGAALDRLLAGTDLSWTQSRPGVFALQTVEGASETATVLDEVVVTGTLLRSSGPPSSPVVQLSRSDLDRSGDATVAQTLADLPQNYAGSATPVVQTLNSDLGASNNVYATGVNLRGLGPAATLVLVNGRRMAGTGSRAEFADVSALPSAAVERVDILLDGASALYGSDAIAGVVNVIMRRSFDGHETRVRASAAQGGAEDVIVSHLAGWDWSTGAAYLSYEHQSSNALSSYDRPYTADGDLRSFGGSDRRSFYSSPGNIVAFDAATSSYVTLYGIRPNATGAAVGPADFLAGAPNLQSTNLGMDVLPELERHSVYGRLTQTLGDRFEMTADLRYSRRANDLATAANAGVFTVGRANPFFVSPTGAATHTIAYSFVRDLGPARTQATSESIGATLGGRYELPAGWSAEAYVTGAEERADFGATNRINSRFLAEALGNIPDDPATSYRPSADGYFNIFGSGTANSRAVLDFIGSGYSEVHNLSQATSINLLVQGPLVALPAGDLSVALGAQTREESFETEGLLFLSAATPVRMMTPKRERSISAAFAEIRVPLVGPANALPGLRSLELSFAARHEAYSDFGSTTNPKVGLTWSPAESVVLRASWGTSFRAGALPQIFDQGGVSPTFLTRADGSRALTLFLSGGNPNLRPESSETTTVGFDYRPGPDTAFSINAFDTRFQDRIARPVNENAFAALTDPALASFVRLVSPATNPSDLALIESYANFPGFSALYPTTTYAAIVDSRWVNTGAVEVRGVDVSARQGWDVQGARFNLDASVSYILDYQTQSTPTAEVRDVAGLIGFPVKLRSSVGLSWARNDFNARLRWSHVDRYEDRLGTAIGAWDTFDAQLSWTPASLPGVDLMVGIENLLDEDPPFYDGPTGYGFDPGGANLLGRVVSLQLIRRW